MTQEILEELKLVKEQARKSYEKARDANQMEAAAMFLAQIERMLTHKMGIDTLIAELGKTDPMPDWQPETVELKGDQMPLPPQV